MEYNLFPLYKHPQNETWVLGSCSIMNLRDLKLTKGAFTVEGRDMFSTSTMSGS
jgi:hypothetical protein